MKIVELINVPTKTQTNSPQSPGSRGLKINRDRPPKRYFDSVITNFLKSKNIRQK